MKKNFLTLTICLLFGMTMQAQTWTRTLGTTNNDAEVGILPVPGTNYLFNLGMVNISGNNDLVLSKLNSSGTIVWTYNYSTGSGSETAIDFIVDRDSNVVIVGYYISSGSRYCFVLKVDGGSGAVLFDYRTASSNPNAMYRKVIQLNSGYSDDYIVMGVINYPSTNIVSRIANNGTSILWSYIYIIFQRPVMNYTIH